MGTLMESIPKETIFTPCEGFFGLAESVILVSGRM
jgi:hypothetical protein